MITVFVACMACYLLGSISFSFLTGKLLTGKDLRKEGSGNLGATNTARRLGAVPGVVVLLLDGAKGSLAVWIGMWLQTSDQWWLPLTCGCLAIIGHSFPFYLGFKGGKSVATALGVLLVPYPAALLLGLVWGIFIIILSKYVSLGSIVGSSLVPPFILLFDQQVTAAWWFSVAVAGFVIVRHHSNIRRLWSGTEKPFTFRKSSAEG